jgi:pyruvate formate lyase activating enzyme
MIKMGSSILGYIHSVETFGTLDGAGIRFVLFMQGCAMRCAFCHNPDTWIKKGKPVRVEDVMHEIKSYIPFFRLSGGGITVSGGEPALQWRFVEQLFGRCGNMGVHRTLDTSGYCRHGSFERLIHSCDEILFSIKVVDPWKHHELTCSDNAEILQNLRLASDSGVSLIIRYVVIPGVNDTPRDVEDLARLVAELAPTVRVEILAYHRMGRDKWEKLGMTYKLEAVPEATPEDVIKLQTQLAALGVKII